MPIVHGINFHGINFYFLKVSEELRLFNMHEQQKQQKTQGALGLINQVEHYSWIGL